MVLNTSSSGIYGQACEKLKIVPVCSQQRQAGGDTHPSVLTNPIRSSRSFYPVMFVLHALFLFDFYAVILNCCLVVSRIEFPCLVHHPYVTGRHSFTERWQDWCLFRLTPSISNTAAPPSVKGGEAAISSNFKQWWRAVLWFIRDSHCLSDLISGLSWSRMTWSVALKDSAWICKGCAFHLH